MSAAPTMDLMPSNVIEAQIAKMEQDEIIIRALKKKNERLEQEKLEIQLQASVEIATAKLGQAQAFQRITELDKNINDLRNWIGGNCVLRDEGERP